MNAKCIVTNEVSDGVMLTIISLGPCGDLLIPLI